jgi:hypothetical protein
VDRQAEGFTLPATRATPATPATPSPEKPTRSAVSSPALAADPVSRLAAAFRTV